MRHPVELKKEVIRIRKKGLSLQEISERLRIAKSTASLWARDIVLNSKARQRLEKRQIIGRYKTLQIKKRKRKKLLANYREEATRELRLIKFDKRLCKLLVALLFWCEGGKNNQAHVSFVNSDPPYD